MNLVFGPHYWDFGNICFEFSLECTYILHIYIKQSYESLHTSYNNIGIPGLAGKPATKSHQQQEQQQ
jgi:hypothetical protein